MHVLALVLVGICSAWNVAGLVALLRVTRARSDHARAKSRPVSVLKPLNGADAGLYENLKSFFEQDHDELELVFGTTNDNDPALAIVARLRRQFPRVTCQTIVHDGGAALNPKISNLLGMLPHASHDLVLISDSNVRAPRHYVGELARVHAQTSAGIVTNLFAGSSEDSLGGALENVQLNGFCAAGSALPTLVGDAAV
ncbi:MAG TPA: glycosyltransferase, partial [Polyangiaceae bacterium]